VGGRRIVHCLSVESPCADQHGSDSSVLAGAFRDGCAGWLSRGFGGVLIAVKLVDRSPDIYHDIYQVIMKKSHKTRVFMNGRSQAVRIPAEYRFTTSEIYIRRDPQNGDVILSQAPADWQEIFASLDRAHIPDDFLANRDQEEPQNRRDL